MKRVFIVHGWNGHPGEAWFPWLRNELGEIGVAVRVLAMPKPGAPEINTWVSALKQAVGRPSTDTYLVGHSMGGQTILRYLQTLSDQEQVGGVVLVGSFVHLLSATFEDDEDREIARPWLDISIDWDVVRSRARLFTAIFSDNDPYVPLDDKEIFKEKLGAKIKVMPGLGHMGGADKVKELPVVLEVLQSLDS